MRKIYIILLFNSLFVHALVSQTLLQQIENAYNALDSVLYIENIVLSFKEEMKKLQKEMDNTTLELYGFDYINMDSTKRQNTLDSIDNILKNSIHSQEIKIWSIEEKANQFSDKISAKTPIYVLNLVSQDKQTLQIDTGKLAFNLFYFDKHFNPEFYVFVENGQYSDHSDFYPTFSRIIARKVPKAFKRILRKNPQYLLYCYDLEGMNTIMYVLNDKIYVYQIAQMKEYELDDYIQKFKPS